jgi:hypothetical protein
MYYHISYSNTLCTDNTINNKPHIIKIIKKAKTPRKRTINKLLTENHFEDFSTNNKKFIKTVIFYSEKKTEKLFFLVSFENNNYGNIVHLFIYDNIDNIYETCKSIYNNEHDTTDCKYCEVQYDKLKNTEIPNNSTNTSIKETNDKLKENVNNKCENEFIDEIKSSKIASFKSLRYMCNLKIFDINV